MKVKTVEITDSDELVVIASILYCLGLEKVTITKEKIDRLESDGNWMLRQETNDDESGATWTLYQEGINLV